MNKITDYIHSYGESPQALVRGVREAINEGWQPLGGPFVITDPKMLHEDATSIELYELPVVVQAMVKYLND